MIVIVGAGPSGLFAAEKIGDCVVLEEHPEVGAPEQCGGLVNRSSLEELGAFDRSYVLNEVRGAKFYSPFESFEVKRKGTQAVVISRQKFDSYLAGRAAKKGAEIHTSTKVRKIERRGESWLLSTNKKNYKADKLILACGNNTSLVRQAGLDPYPTKNFLKCVQGEAGIDADPEFAELHFSNKFAPGFFGWIIPAGEKVRVGLGTTANPNQNFEAFLKKLNCQVSNRFGALIPILGPLEKTCGEDVILLGDAAGQVKPTTGGGVVMGMKCAEFAAKAVKGNVLSYEKLWRDALERDFQLGLLIHEAQSELSDEQLDRSFKIINENFVEILEEYGHMDKPTQLFDAMKKKGITPQIFALLSQIQAKPS